MGRERLRRGGGRGRGEGDAPGASARYAGAEAGRRAGGWPTPGHPAGYCASGALQGEAHAQAHASESVAAWFLRQVLRETAWRACLHLRSTAPHPPARPASHIPQPIPKPSLTRPPPLSLLHQELDASREEIVFLIDASPAMLEPCDVRVKQRRSAGMEADGGGGDGEVRRAGAQCWALGCRGVQHSFHALGWCPLQSAADKQAGSQQVIHICASVDIRQPFV